MERQKYLAFGLMIVLIISTVFISGCLQEESPIKAPTTTLTTPIPSQEEKSTEIEEYYKTLVEEFYKTIEEEMPTEVPEITTPPAASSTFTTPIPSQEEKSTEIVTGIVEEYYKTHTYSEYDLFVCGDMAIDVWNMVETQGINAQIAVGNVDNPDADWTEYNHAWVLAEVSPDTWLALEATGGYVTYDENYYRGYFFKNPREFKEYLELMKEYNAQIDRINQLLAECSDTYDELVKETDYYQELVNEYNRKYAEPLLSPAEYQDSLSLQSRINAQGIVVTRVEGKAEQLVYIVKDTNNWTILG